MTLEDFLSTIKNGTMESAILEIRNQENFTQFYCSPNAKVLDPYRQNDVEFWFTPSLPSIKSSIKADIVVSINMDGVRE